MKRSVPYESSSAKSRFGNHFWLEDGRSLRWDSDASSAIKDFRIYTYTASSPITGIVISWSSGDVRFFNKDASGRGGGLMLAVYEGIAPPSLFRGKEPDFFATVKPAFGPRSWTKLEGARSRSLTKLFETVRFRSPITKFAVVLVGIDPWIDTRVTISINELSVKPSTSKN